MFANNNLSLADIAAVTNGNRNNNNGGFGDGNGWWVLIILFAIFGGWGNGGWGNNANNGGGRETIVVPVGNSCCDHGCGSGGWGAFDAAALQRGFDNQTVINKLDGINSGICSLGYDQLAQMNGINQTVQQTGFNIISNQQQNAMSAQAGNFALQQAIQQNAIANMQGFNDVSRSQERCCCENREGQAQIRFDMSNYNCQTNTNIHQTGDAIIQNQNQGFQMLNNTIRDGFTALSMEAKDREIAQLRNEVNRANLQSDLQGTASYIIGQVSPRTQPAYLTCNPNTGNVFPQAGIDQWRYATQGNCGCNTGCGCNSGCC